VILPPKEVWYQYKQLLVDSEGTERLISVQADPMVFEDCFGDNLFRSPQDAAQAVEDYGHEDEAAEDQWILCAVTFDPESRYGSMINRINNITVNVDCQHCGKSCPVQVVPEQYSQWKQGIYIQDAMPQLSPDDRELLMSRTCTACWDEMFGPEDDE